MHLQRGPFVRAACAGTEVPEAFLAGLISNENAQLLEWPSRFEPRVFRALRLVKLGLYVRRTKWGVARDYNGITRAHLQLATPQHLTALATSWGDTQVMGYHAFTLHCSVSDLQDPSQHLPLAVRLLGLNSGAAAERQGRTNYFRLAALASGPSERDQAFECILRTWNGGGPKAATFSPAYVPHALAVIQAYERLIQRAQLVTQNV